MKKTGPRQPINLAQLRRRGKENLQMARAPETHRLAFPSQIDHRLEQPDWIGTVLADNISFMMNTMGGPCQRKQELNRREQSNDEFGMINPSSQLWQKVERTRNIHQTTISTKPFIQNTSSQHSQHPFCRQKPLDCNRRKQIDCQGEGGQSRPEDSNSDSVASQRIAGEEEIALVQKSQEDEIAELWGEKANLQQKLVEADERERVREQEKQRICQRISAVEVELQRLTIEKEELQTIQHELSISKVETMNWGTQTESSSMDSFNSHLTPDTTEEEKALDQKDGQGRAKSLKGELEWLKIHASNRQRQFEVALENKEIEWRQQVRKLDKQCEILRDQLSSKCSEVREKDAIINSLLQKQR